MARLILRNRQSPGDVLMLTAAVRDLHRQYPGRYQTDVRTTAEALWENNPHLTPLAEEDAAVETLDCHYPLIHHSNQRPVHFLRGFISFLNDRLGLEIQLSEQRGDVHLSAEELAAPSAVAKWCGGEVPYWIIAAGGKWDFTIKWWDIARWQAVVDHFAGRLFFVQVGERGHYHPRLRGALDLRGRTSLRALVRLVHHASGIACPVTCLMHLAAAVPRPAGQGGERPCVVVAGGREPVGWEAYPGHHFLHTIGELPCCATGGCWRARTAPLGDDDPKDEPSALCQWAVCLGDGPPNRAFPAESLDAWRTAGFQPAPHLLPECMHRITAEDVIAVIESTLGSRQACAMTRIESRQAASGLARMESQRSRESIRAAQSHEALSLSVSQPETNP